VALFKPEGVYPAMVTPFDDRGHVNETELRKLVNWLIDEGVSGLFPLGSVGEFIHLSFEEKVRIMEIVCSETRGRVPVTPGTTESCAVNCIKLTEKAKTLGSAAVVIAPPYYLPVGQEQIEAHYEQVFAAVPDFPIILYNIPLFSVPIDYDVVKRLSRHPCVVGMKDSSGSMVDFMHYMDKIRLIGTELNILIGREEMLYAGLMVGAKGAMCGTVGIVPEIMTGIYKAWNVGDVEKAMEMQFSVLQLIRALFALPFPLGFKAALEIRGFKMGESKRPLSDADQYNYQKVKSRIEILFKQLNIKKVVV
jgi:N-acetylneuraminate lyase/4-hydroxy-tetrahydrodipicolinate synthase